MAVKTSGGEATPELPPLSDETSAQLAARLRATLSEGRDMAEYRDLIAIRPSSQPTQARSVICQSVSHILSPHILTLI